MRIKCIRENSYGTISCEDHEVLDIIRARYGRISALQDGCGEESNWFCVARNSLEVVQRVCQLKNTCTIHPHYTTFNGYPCPGYLKFLEVQYNCQSTPTSSVSAPKESLLTVRPTDGISTTLAESPDGTTPARIFPYTSTNITSANTLLTTVGETSDSSRSLGVIIGPIAAASILILTIVATLIFVFTRKRNISQQPDKSVNENRNRAITDRTPHFNDVPVSNPSQIRSEFDDYLTMTSATIAERVYEVALEFSETNPPLQQTPGYQTVKINPADDSKYTAHDVTTAGNDIPSSTSEYIANGAVPGDGEYEERSVVFQTKGICLQGDSDGYQTINVLPSKQFERTDHEANPSGHDYEVIGTS